MADFSALKTSIQNYIKQNGNEEITGNLLQQILLSMVSTLGDSAINDLVTSLNNEVSARQNADGTLQTNINNEATARGNADTELDGRITTLQGVVNGIVDNVENGYVYAGIATPSTTPVSGKVFYLALTAGIYTNFGSIVVPQGINILKYNGSAWSLDSFLGLDDTPTQGSSNLVKSGGVLDSIIKDGSAFDLSAYNNGTTYADLSAALTALNALPAAYKKGGMSIKYVQSSDNKYVQARCMAQNFTTDASQWETVDEKPSYNSPNITKSATIFDLRMNAIGGTFPALFDNRYSYRDDGSINPDDNISSYALLYNLYIENVYSITFNTDYRFELLLHKKSDGTFVRDYWRNGTYVITKELRDTYDYARIRVQTAAGSKPDFDTLVSNSGLSVVTLGEFIYNKNLAVNISELFPTGGTGDSDVYTLANATTKVPVEFRRGGMFITFKTADNNWVAYQLDKTNGFSTNVAYWHQVMLLNNDDYLAAKKNLIILQTGIVFYSDTTVETQTVLFTKDNIKSGDTIYYEISNKYNDSYSPNCAVAFFDSSDNRLGYFSIENATSVITKEGQFVVPDNFSYAKTIWGRMDLVNITVKSVSDNAKDIQNIFNAGIENIGAIQANVLFSDNYTQTLPTDEAVSINKKVFEKAFTENNVPSKLYLKIDSVSANNNDDIVARLDLYYSQSNRVYRYYHRADVGNFVGFDVPSNTIRVDVILQIRAESSSEEREQVYSGITLTLTPSIEKYALYKVYDTSEKFDNDVFSDEVQRTADRITELSAKPCLVYNIMTDSHENLQDDNSKRVVNNTLSNIQRVSDLAFADGAVHLGDILVAGQAEMYSTWQKVNAHLDNFVGRFRKVNRECFIAVGNHDGLQSNSNNEFYTYGSLQKFNESYVVREGIAPWYYKDYLKIKTRVAFLAMPSNDLVENPSFTVWQIYKNQMAWIANTVFNVEDGWNILFICHIHPYSVWADDGVTVFEGLTNAFCNHTTYQNNDWNINVDYSAKTHSKVLAFICGHTHADAVITDNSVFEDYNLEYPIICIASSNMNVGGNSHAGYTNPTRNQYSITEDLWDTMVYRPDLGKIYMVRFGAGEDREINV